MLPYDLETFLRINLCPDPKDNLLVIGDPYYSFLQLRHDSVRTSPQRIQDLVEATPELSGYIERQAEEAAVTVRSRWLPYYMILTTVGRTVVLERDQDSHSDLALDGRELSDDQLRIISSFLIPYFTPES